MRKQFSEWLEAQMASSEKSLLITGDLGFMAFEGVEKIAGHRFINAGVAEQNMISVAAALAYEGMDPICYSIAPFTVFRPAEQIRLDVCLHNLNVKIVGNGGGYGYGIMGATHHALEDLGHLSSYQNMVCYIPFCNEDVSLACEAMVSRKGPGYLRLGFGAKASDFELPPFAPIRKIKHGSLSSDWTILGVGPCLLGAAGVDADTFAVSELPLANLSTDFMKSLVRTQKLLILEEHVQKSGLAEHIALLLFKNQILPKRVVSLSAKGYPTGRYGSQSFHVHQSGLDPISIRQVLNGLENA